MPQTMLNSMIKKLKSALLISNEYYNYLRRANTNVKKPMPVYTKALKEGLKVHLGAGPINIQGWINVDAREAPHVHIVTEVLELNEFSDESIAEIYMCHVLEHFSFQEVETLLAQFYKKLTTGGVLRLSVPDFDKLVTIYQAEKNDISIIKSALMGGQDYEFNFHKAFFNEKSLRDTLTSAGYGDIQLWETEDDFGVDLGDWSNKSFITASGTYAISLNIKATKVN
jgi:predicted SAM-dependent methyltransferase